MTDEELHRILTNLTAHLKAMRDDRHGSGLNAPSGSGNGGKAPKGGKPKLPCSADLLSWEAELHFELSEPAEELAADYPADCWKTPRQDPTKGTDSVAWATWLNHPRHRALILTKDWDLPAWLQEKESELRHMLHPDDPQQQAEALAGIVTVDYLKERGYKPGTIRQWRARGVLEQVGNQRLSSGEVIELYQFTRPPASTIRTA